MRLLTWLNSLQRYFARPKRSYGRRSDRRRASCMPARQTDALENRLLLTGAPIDEEFFAQAVSDALQQFDRVLSAVDEVDQLAAKISWLGEQLPESVGNTTAIAGLSLADVFDLSDMFRTEVIQPLQTFLNNNPTANAAQIASQFGFIQPAAAANGVTEGLTIQFDINGTLATPLAGLIDQLQGVDSLFNAIDGDALDSLLNFDFQLPELNFQILRDTADRIGISIPDISLNVGHSGEIPINFAAGFGFLSGAIDTGSIDLDLDVLLNPGQLFRTGSLPEPLAGMITLEDLRQISTADILDALQVAVGGSGLSVELPFEFQLPGLETGGFWPQFSLDDLNPLDAEFPKLDLNIPLSAPYEIADLLGFQTIDASAVLGALDQLGQVFGQWEAGELLNLPIPLAEGLTVGDAIGLAEGYGGAVLQFLKNPAGGPAFGSAQELASLIPALSNTGPNETLRYNAASKQLILSLDFLRNPDPIIAQANISAFVGNQNSPVASFEMSAGTEGIDNRLEITRSASLGLELAIGLYPEALHVPQIVDQSQRDLQDVAEWTPMVTVLQRLALSHLADVPQLLEVRLRSGQLVTADMGTINQHITLGEWLERGTVRDQDGKVLMTMRFVPVDLSTDQFGLPLEPLPNRLLIVDHTTGGLTTRLTNRAVQHEIQFDITYTDAAGTGFLDNQTFVSDGSDPILDGVTTVGGARQAAFTAALQYLASLIQGSYANETWRIEAGFFADEDTDNIGHGLPVGVVEGENIRGGQPGVSYPRILANHLNGAEITDQPGASISFNALSDFIYSTIESADLCSYSLYQLTVHEMMHALGFLDSFQSDGSLGFDQPTLYDTLVLNGSGTRLIDLPSDTSRETALRSGNLRFSGPNAARANTEIPGDQPHLYAPAVYNPTATAGHFDLRDAYEQNNELQLPGYNPFVIPPQVLQGMSLAALYDIGYLPPSSASTNSAEFIAGLFGTEDIPIASGTGDLAEFGLSSIALRSTVAIDDPSTPLIHLLPPSEQNLDAASDPLLITLLDGSTETINFGTLADKTLSDLLDAFTINRPAAGIVLQAVVEANSIVLRDLSTPVPGGRFSVEWAGEGQSRAIEQFVQPARASIDSNEIQMAELVPALPYDLASSVDLSTTLGSLLTGTPHQHLLGTTSTADVHLRNGHVISVSTGVLAENLTLAELTSRMFSSNENGDGQLFARFSGINHTSDRLLLIDLTDGPHEFHVADTTQGGGFFSALFSEHLLANQVQDADRDGKIPSRSLSLLPGSRLPAVQAPAILTDVAQTVPAWTTIATILERNGVDPDQTPIHTARIQLRDGTQFELRVQNARAMTLGDLVRQSKQYRNGQLIAELTLNQDGTLSLQEYNTTATGDLTVIQVESTGSFFSRFLNSGATAEAPNTITGRPLNQSTLTNNSQNLRMIQILPDSSPYREEIGASLRMRLPDGTVKSVSANTPFENSLQHLLEALTVRRDGRLLTRAEVINDRITVTYLGDEGDHPFEINFDGINLFTRWLGQFVPLGRFAGNVATGQPLLAPLPSAVQPPVGDQTPVADFLVNKLMRSLLDQSSTVTATVHLRNGTSATISTGPIDETLTLHDLMSRLTITDGNQVQLRAYLVDDTMVLQDETIHDGSSRLRLSNEVGGTFFSQLGLMPDWGNGLLGDADGDARLQSESLATHRISADVTLGEILGTDPAIYEDLIPGEDIFIHAGDNRATTFDFVNPGPQTTLQQVADAFNFDFTTLSGDREQLRTSARVVDGRIVVSDLSVVSDQAQTFSVQGFASRQFSADFFSSLYDYDQTGEVSSDPFWRPLQSPNIQPSTSVGEYLRQRQVEHLIQDALSIPLVVTLSNGTTETLTLRLSDSTTLHEIAQAMRIERNGQSVFEVQLLSNTSLFGAHELNFVLHDRTADTSSGISQFSVMLDQTQNPPDEALLLTLLGLLGEDALGTGVLVGNNLSNQNTGDRVRIMFTEPPVLHAEFNVTASDVNASLQLGELLGAGIQNGYGTVSGMVDIAFRLPEGRDFVTLTELLNSLGDPGELIDVTIDADAAFGGELFVDFAGLNVQPDNPGQIPRIDFTWNNIVTTQPQLALNTDTLNFGYTNFDRLLQFDGLSVQDITQLIRRVVDLIERISGDDLLNRQLPLINKSLDDILNSVDYVAKLVAQIQNDPEVGLDLLETRIESLLQLDPGQFALLYDPAQDAIRVELNLTVNPDLTVNPGAQSASLNLDLAAAGLDGLESLVDFQANGNVNVDASANLRLHLGLDLDVLKTGSFDDAVFVYGSTGIFADAIFHADNLQLTTTIANLGVDIGPGQVRFDSDGLAFGGPENNTAAMLSIALNDPTAVYSLSSLTASDFDFTFDGAVGVDLPISFLAATDEPLKIHWPDLNSFQFTQVAAININNGNQIVLPDLSSAISGFSIADGVYALVAGIEGLFDLIDQYLGDQVLGIPVPVIGEALDNIVNFADQFRDQLSGNLAAAGTDIAADAARNVIFDTLGPGNLNILDDLNDDGSITIEDVDFVLSTSEVSYRLKLGQDLIGSPAMIDLDIGVTALGLEVGGDVAASFGYGFDVGFGLSETDGVFVEFYDGDEIRLNFEASVDDLTAQGRLGPLTITATTLDALQLTDAQRLASRLDPDDATSETINAVAGEYAIDLGSGRMTLSELFGSGLANIQTEARLAGSLHVLINTSLGSDARMPSIEAGLHLTWPGVQGSIADIVAGLSQPTVELTNVALDLGGFISDVVAPILEPINDFLDPIRPVLDAITTPIPVLSDIAGDTTFVDLVGIFGDGAESIGPFVEAVADLARLIDVPIVNGSVKLPLGNFATTYDNGRLVPTESGGAFGGLEDFDSFLSSVSDDAVRNYLSDMPRTADEVLQPGKFSVPIFNDPLSAVGLLFGQDVDLIQYRAPTLEASFNYSQYIPIWPIFGITIGGSFNMVADFGFGYDTSGIRKFADTGRKIDLFDGFYLADTYTDGDGNVFDPAELQFSLGLTAGGEINLLAASAGVEGGLYATIDLNLNDPNLDGKVRAGELLANLQLGQHPLLGPLWVFDASGQLEAGLSLYASVLGFRGELELGPFKLLDFNVPRPQPANPVLGQVSNGTLTINVGPNSARRLEGDLTDGDDDILIAFDQDTGDVIVSGFGRDQAFANVQRVYIDSGAGDDSITIDADLLIPVEVHLGSGDDELQGGGGPLNVWGGDGSDSIVGSPMADIIRGGAGRDRIDGRDGDDLLRGGEDADQIQGGRGQNRIHCDQGNDTLTGGSDTDFMFGGDGSDVIDGGAGNDVIKGEAEDGSGFGHDFLQGNAGDDLIEGGPGNDQLFGNAGSDQLFGGAGNDLLIAGNAAQDSPLFAQLQNSPDTSSHTLDGGFGNDRIYGSAGPDVVTDLAGLNFIYTYEGDDRVTTGSASDTIETGTGNDIVQTSGGNNTIRTGAGFDIVITGRGADFIDLRPTDGSVETAGGEVTDAGGRNRIFTDNGTDIITAAGDNFIHAGAGNNVITTFGGNDVIRTLSGNDTINAGDGRNEISSGAGDDVVITGADVDIVQLGDGQDQADTGAGDDVVFGGNGMDLINAGSGDDIIRGQAGNDVLVAGLGFDDVQGGDGSDVIWGGLEQFTRAQLEASLLLPTGYAVDLAFAGFIAPHMRPAVANGLSITTATADGSDTIDGGNGNDFLFGDGGDDLITDAAGTNYIDAGSGNDDISGGAGSDIILGGAGSDILRGGSGIDFLYGGDGDDHLHGDAGQNSELFGQMLFGEAGNDTLWAFAPTNTAAEYSRRGDRLDGGPGADTLLGNLRREVLIGGSGDDRLEGDGLAGPNYAINLNFATTGGADQLFGDNGDDILLGGGGNDIIWGGRNTDTLEGHAGTDQLYGGSNIDFIHLDVDPLYASAADTIDGHFGNAEAGDFEDDSATDILVIPGTIEKDTILLSETSDGDLQILWNGQTLNRPWRTADGVATIDQFRINGLAGDDILGFVSEADLRTLTDPALSLFHVNNTLPVELSDVALRSSDWAAVIDGGDGNYIIKGSSGRDRLNGGPGSDIIFGVAGDDRLWGDQQDGASLDNDLLFAGTGNDDLIGGTGTNELYAWTSDPTLGDAETFGIFLDEVTGQRYDAASGSRVLEDTGLNRILGRARNDQLYGGTGLDFLYGGEGQDTLYDRHGQPLVFALGVPEEEEWLQYARSTDRVWYYGGTGANDVITVDYVTEPGILGDHHLITRLTENNGFYTFDAQVHLDFEATSADGRAIWNPQDIVYRVDDLNTVVDYDARALGFAQLQLEGNILPAEGDFLAIIIDAQAGDDEIYVGPTVQRSVWVAAGAGDDRVEFSAGSALLADRADAGDRNELAVQPDNATRAYQLSSQGNGPSYAASTVNRLAEPDSGQSR